MKLKCGLCGESFDVDEFCTEITSTGYLIIVCPNECILFERQLSNFIGDIKEEQ